MIRKTVQQQASSLRILALCLATLWMSGCGVLGDNSSRMTVTPASASIRAGATQQFTAQGMGSGSQQPGAPSSGPERPGGPHVEAVSMKQSQMQTQTGSSSVTWSVNGVAGGNATVGTISSQGLYTAPSTVPTSPNVTVTATSQSLSGMAAVSLENPMPVVQGVQPNPINVGAFSITVSGSMFVKGAVVLLNGTALQTTFVSATQLTATGTATDSQVGNATVTVKNPDPGAIVSQTSVTLQIQPALVVKVKVSPATAQIRIGGSQQFSATVTGTGNTAVTWSVNGVAGGNATLGTVSANGLYVSPASVPNPNTIKVTATSVADSRASDSANVTLQNPVPAVTTVSPNPVNVGDFKITVNGSNFVNGAAVVFDSQLLVTTFVSSTQLTAVGTATNQEVGQVPVLVQNPNPGSADSNTVNEQVSAQGNQVSAMVAARFLEQSSWGPTPNTIAQVQQAGLQTYLQQQFNAPVSTYPTPGAKDDLTAVQKPFFVNATQGQDQLRQRVSFALSEITVVSAVKIGDPTAFSLWMNMLQNDAFGNFSTLLKDVTLSPTMGYYLDMGNNDGCNGCAPNENYAREVMQLFSIGLMQLNPDGSPQLDQSGDTIPTYTQDTIEGFAHVFTGWSYPPLPGKKAQFYSEPYFSGPMLPFNSHYDQGSKLLLNGTTLPAGGDIQADLNSALMNIFNHPNVGPFISKQLIQKLVTSNPSPDYVTRVTQAFNDNGSGVRGDMKAVITAILLDPEARRGDDPLQMQSSDGHLHEPLLHMMATMRAANTTTDGENLMYYAANMRQEPFRSPTVFNFYPPNYQVPGTQLLGPEFKILNSSTTISRVNFVNDLIYGSISNKTKTDLSAYVAVAGDVNKLIDMVNVNMMHSQMSDGMRTTLVNVLTAIADKKRRAQAAIYLTASSSQFQMEH